MHVHNNLKSSASSKLFVLLLIGIIVVCITSFMWCYTQKLTLSREIAELRKESKLNVATILNLKQQQQNVPQTRDEKSQSQPQRISSSPSNLPRAVSQMKYRIVVFTYLRPDGLVRLLKSLQNSYYPQGSTIALTILVDFPKILNKKPHQQQLQEIEDERKTAARQETLEVVKNFKWNHGPLVVHRRQVNVGLKKNILESWYPPSSMASPLEHDNEVCLLLEDDIEVSPFWFDWAAAAVERYYFQPRESDPALARSVLGISLYRPIHDEQSHRTCIVDDNHNEPFLLQQPCSWGAIYFPEPWRAFRDWYDGFDASGEEPVVITERGEEPDANSWAKSSSWKKYLIRFMHERGWAMVYPNLPETLVYSTNHLMKGEHPTPNRKLFELPLLDLDHAKKIWPSKSDVVQAMVEQALIVGEANSDGNKKNKHLSLINPNEDLPELKRLKSFDVMFHEEKGGAEALLRPKKNLAAKNDGHYRHHAHGKK